jgi:fluoroquinolone transport system permease protein
MRRLAATLGTDVRLQFRNGFYYATAVAVAFSIALLRWLPAGAAALILPVVILENVLMNAFYFVSGLVLLERVEGTFTAQSVTPLRTGEYLASKLVTLTALSLVESLTIAAAVFGLDAPLLAMAAGIGVSAALFCLAGVALVVRYDSINEFLMPSVVYTMLLTLPILSVFGIGPAAWYLAHPIQGPLTLMQIDVAHTAGGLTYGIGYPLLWIAPAYIWSRRALRQLRHP